jgi:beta-lactamase class A
VSDTDTSRRLELEPLIAPLIDAFSGEVSVAFARFDRPESYTRAATRTMLSASLIKLPVLLTVLAEAARGRLELSERLTVRADDAVGGSGILQDLDAGLTPTLRDLLTLMIVLSDNTATNLVIGRVGLGAVNTFCQQHGFSGTRLVGKLALPEHAYNEAQRRGERNRTCAADMLGLLTGLVRGDLLPPTETDLALGILKAQRLTEGLARPLPTDPELAAPGTAVEVASKSGCLRGVWHDAGVVFQGGAPRYALVVMTQGAADRRFHVDQEGVRLIAEVSRRLFDALAS